MAFTPQLLHNLFSHPLDRVAICQGSNRITYRELSARVDQLASYLHQLGIGPAGTVAICLERSEDWIIAALATMRVGAAYCPLDVTWPDERMRHAITDSGAEAVVSTSVLLERLSLNIPSVDQRRDVAVIAAAPPFEPLEVTSEMLAYLIYTSGSTGAPKGVEITHGNLDHLIAWHGEAFQVTEADRASHLAGLAFDAAGWEVWPYLAAGATVVLVDETVRSSAELLQQWMLKESITIGFVPTALATSLFNLPWPNDTDLRYLLTGGDTLHSGPAEQLPFPVVNNYGPTECTVVATSGIVPPNWNTVPTIGSAIKGATLYILHQDGTPVADGEIGEICVGGAGVARGYRNLPSVTEQSFVPDPFSPVAGSRMYRTGDQGIRDADGQVAFHGRLDRQVKIRGQRIELGEIDSVLNHHPKVAFAVVIASSERSDGKQLVAYIHSSEGQNPSSSELQDFLAKRLPAYMIPSVFVRLNSIPLTPNGKLDRSALAPASNENLLSRDGAREVLSHAETVLLAMVRELLGTEDINVEDDFFLIGGHSLLGSQLVLRIRQRFGIQFTLRDLFNAPTSERLATCIETMLIAEVDALAEDEALRQIGS